MKSNRKERTRARCICQWKQKTISTTDVNKEKEERIILTELISTCINFENNLCVSDTVAYLSLYLHIMTP